MNKKIQLIGIVVILIALPLTVILAQRVQNYIQHAAEPDNALEKTLEKNLELEKYTDEEFKNYEAVPAMHYKIKSRAENIENPGYGLGHCDLKSAPREIDTNDGWIPPC